MSEVLRTYLGDILIYDTMGDYITFVDPSVAEICIAHYDTNGSGTVSYAEAAAVNDLSNYFRDSSIQTFDELQYFTGLTSIGYAFSYCSSLTSVTIPDSVTSIGNSAFYNCSGLTSVTIPNSVTSIGGGAFSGCSGLTSVTIPDSVTSIGNSAFQNCSGLTSVTIGDSVTSIGNSAFQNCSGLTSVTIPDSVTSIDYIAFTGCTSLTSITVESGNSKYDSRNNCNAIIDTSTNTIITGCKNTVIPDSVTSIGRYAFSDCSSLTSVTIPDSVTSIGRYAFNNCSGLTSVTIPDSVTSIGYSAFYGCSGLTSVTIGDSVTTIGDYAFCNYPSLTSVTIENTVPPSIGKYIFVTNNPPNIYVPAASVETYKSASGWSNYADKIQAIPE